MATMQASPSAATTAGSGRASHPATRSLRYLVGAGFVARAFTYALIGAIAVALAVDRGRPPASPDQQGALSLIARAPIGKVALIAVAVGLLAYALWKLALAFVGTGPEGGGGHDLQNRVANFGGAIVYFVFCAVAVRILVDGGGSQRAEQQHAAAGALGWPGGHWFVALAGLVMIAISVHQVLQGVLGRFAEDNKTGEMSEHERRVFLFVGRVGLTARALVFALVGYFLVRTAIDFKPSEGVGIDGTLEQLRQLSYGPWVLGLIAVGMFVFALFSLFEARYQRL
jgi:hypothetical protein